MENQDITAWAAVISAAVALLAVVVGPALALVVAKKQIAATAELSERRELSTRLRDGYAQIAAAVSSLAVAVYPMEPAELKRRVDELMLLKARLSVLLRPDRADEAGLNKTLNSILDAAVQVIGPERAEGSLSALNALVNQGTMQLHEITRQQLKSIDG